MIYNITQLEWENKKAYCSIRDYSVRDHLARKATMRVVFGDLYMDIPYKKLMKPKEIIKESIQSKFNLGQTYKLRSYEWKPKSIKEEEAKVKDKILKGYR